VPIAALGLIATAFVIPNSKNPSAQRSDPIGAARSIVGLGLLLWGIIEAPTQSWSSAGIVNAVVAAAVLLVLFVLWERRSDHPMLPMRSFRNRRYSAAIASLGLVMFALLGMFFLMTQYFQFCLGFDPLKTGLAIGPIALVLLMVAPLSVQIVRRLGTKIVVSSGLLLIALGLGFLSRTTIDSTYRDALPLFILMGAGVGLALAPSTDSIMGS
jgi:Na+/melibiose symporter-like transporter